MSHVVTPLPPNVWCKAPSLEGQLELLLVARQAGYMIDPASLFGEEGRKITQEDFIRCPLVKYSTEEFGHPILTSAGEWAVSEKLEISYEEFVARVLRTVQGFRSFTEMVARQTPMSGTAPEVEEYNALLKAAKETLKLYPNATAP